ncbi:MAG: protein-glutamate O-methyltransferase CheR [Bryobacteraceae bacterium]|nr:protein-glutamate O-methyltransferase CheR [Bryobacteraceae bacterium]
MYEKCAEVPVLTSGQFDKIRQLLYQKAGIDIQHGKEQLVSSRLGKKLREHDFRSFDQYYDHVVNDRTGESLISLINALSTNFTYFFREPDHFEFLRSTILPTLKARNRVEVWCAAASTGEEPYTIAISVLEELGWSHPARILSTDISTKTLAEAKKATYPEERFREMPRPLMQKYLLRGHDASHGWYQVKPEVRKLVEFSRLNLIESFSHPQPFPVIFCRNVMIYFDKATQERVVGRLTMALEPGGYLLIGHAESLSGISHSLEYVRPAVYRKPMSARTQVPEGRVKR